MISLKSTIKELNNMNKGTLMEQLGMEYTSVEEGLVKAKMPVDKRTIQPFMILHGGASLAFAETIASLGSAVLVDLDQYDVRGAAVTGNHIGAVARGFVYGEAKILHRGTMTHVWDVEIKDQGGYRVSVARVTILVISKHLQKKTPKPQN
jgi:1,4-dihydroxy-2-naphthoyl-CoA hydrolase